MTPVTPFWFKQRQAKAEEAGPDLVKVTGPNLKEAFVGIRQIANGYWQGFVRPSADGPDEEATDATLSTPYEGWEAAFEIYRRRRIV